MAGINGMNTYYIPGTVLSTFPSFYDSAHPASHDI